MPQAFRSTGGCEPTMNPEPANATMGAPNATFPRLESYQPRPEEVRSAVSKDGHKRDRACGHPSRRALRALLRMRFVGLGRMIRTLELRHERQAVGLALTFLLRSVR